MDKKTHRYRLQLEIGGIDTSAEGFAASAYGTLVGWLDDPGNLLKVVEDLGELEDATERKESK